MKGRELVLKKTAPKTLTWDTDADANTDSEGIR